MQLNLFMKMKPSNYKNLIDGKGPCHEGPIDMRHPATSLLDT